MRRSRFQFSLLGLFVLVSLAGVACFVGPPILREIIGGGVFAVIVALLITFPFYFMAFCWLKDLPADYGLNRNRPDSLRAQRLPDRLDLPEGFEPPSTPDRPPRRRQRRRLAGWWHPMGGYPKRW
jgi:hypothetical protein